jgi:hypothetical protein
MKVSRRNPLCEQLTKSDRAVGKTYSNATVRCGAENSQFGLIVLKNSEIQTA